MKPINKHYVVRFGDKEPGYSNDLKMEVDLITNVKTFSTEESMDIEGNGNWDWVKVPVKCPFMIKNIEVLIEKDVHVIEVGITFSDGSYVMHSRSVYPDRVYVYIHERGEFLYHITNRRPVQKDSDTYEHDLLWSLCWDHFPLHWIDANGLLEQY